MKMRFHGACGVVTGSMTELMDEKLGVHFLVDCGATEGVDTPLVTRGRFDFDPRQIQFVLLTHAHADHCGRLPELVRAGFTGAVYCTEATMKLALVALRDAAGQEATNFSVEDVNRIRWQICEPYKGYLHIANDGRLTSARDASMHIGAHRSSHLLGSVGWAINWGPDTKRNPVVIFSGDVGPHHDKEDGVGGLLANNHPPHAFAESVHTTLVLESTYGGRLTMPATREHRRDALLQLVRGIVHSGGKLLIPAFALGRVQEVLLDLYVLKQLTHSDELGALKIYTPSRGMAREASEIHVDQLVKTVEINTKRKHEVRLLWPNRRMFRELGLRIEDHEATQAVMCMLRIAFGLEGNACQSVDSPAQFIQAKGPAVFVAPSGMGDAGMMASALKALVCQDDTTVALVGYAARGTVVARMRDMLNLSENDRMRQNILLWPDERVTASQLRAKIVSLDGYGGHAPAPTLWRYMVPNAPDIYKHPDTVCFVHGDERARRDLAMFFSEQCAQHGLSPKLRLPKQLEWIDLETVQSREVGELMNSLRPQLARLGEMDWDALEHLVAELFGKRCDGSQA
jgi:metallo-beta-lactamase family protein